MASTFTAINIHFVFGTKNRKKLIDHQIRSRLWAYMGGIAKKHNMIPHAIGGIDDHVHLLITLPPTISPSKAIQLIKSGSSKWIHEEFPERKRFTWQSGFGAFAVNQGRLTHVIDYIQKQEEHHHKKTFEEEYLDFLNWNGIEFDQRFVFG